MWDNLDKHSECPHASFNEFHPFSFSDSVTKETMEAFWQLWRNCWIILFWGFDAWGNYFFIFPIWFINYTDYQQTLQLQSSQSKWSNPESDEWINMQIHHGEVISIALQGHSTPHGLATVTERGLDKQLQGYSTPYRLAHLTDLWHKKAFNKPIQGYATKKTILHDWSAISEITWITTQNSQLQQ